MADKSELRFLPVDTTKVNRPPGLNKRLNSVESHANDCGYAVAQPFSIKKYFLVDEISKVKNCTCVQGNVLDLL